MNSEIDATPEKIQTQTLRDQNYKSIKISVCTSMWYIDICFCLGFFVDLLKASHNVSHYTLFLVTQSIMAILAFAC